ncbi:MAG: hypothetical protein IJI41_03880 [Anaerolineaceae bacterium]|nr:hypothetical protein [Anaerolineaceae bacterium]
MTENLFQLKMILPILAAGTAVLVYIVSQQVLSMIQERFVHTDNFAKIGTERESNTEMNERIQYERIIRRETLKYTWIMHLAAITCLVLLIASVLLHGHIINKTGIELFCTMLLVLSSAAVYFILQCSNWKKNASRNLYYFSKMFNNAAGNLHSGIRMMLYESEFEFPMKPLLLEISKHDPGLSGRELLIAAGELLKSEKLVNGMKALKNDTSNPEEKDGERIFKADFLNLIFAFFAFGIVLVLCFLL